MDSYLFLQKCKQQHLDKLKEVKTPWVPDGPSSSYHILWQHLLTSYLIYLISYRVCGIQYVGETRTTSSGSSVTTNLQSTPTPVGHHFNLPNHSITDMILQGTESHFYYFLYLKDFVAQNNVTQKSKITCSTIYSVFSPLTSADPRDLLGNP